MTPVAPPNCTQELGAVLWRHAPFYANGLELIDKIIAAGDAAEEVAAEVGGNLKGDSLKKIRHCKLAWFKSSDEQHRWLFEELAKLVWEVNSKMYRFDLSYIENLQYTVYDSRDGDQHHYDWHIDSSGPGAQLRKLSMSMLLSDPMDFDGGELQVWGAQKTPCAREKGLAHFFPSTMLHRVTPVTAGVRKSLVAWVVGPDWR